MTAEHAGGDLAPVVLLLGAAVVAVPLFKRLGLGSVLGYLCAGLAVGPFGFAWFDDPGSVLHVAELGVVMFLFVIGLEMRPSHLWNLRKAIFGLGSMQAIVCGALLTLVGTAFGLPWAVSLICAMSFVLTSTAIVMQILDERGGVAAPRGQRIVAILLLEDLLIVPLLALVAFLAPPAAGAHAPVLGVAALVSAAGSVGVLVIAGIWLLNPLFALLAKARAREAMTGAALFVVLGAALLMQIGGLSMALGAFLAGVLLSESTFRHQLAADIEPFRGILLGLFFLGVGMSLDLSVVSANAGLIAAGVIALMGVKALCVYVVARLARSSHEEAIDRALLMAQGGEFAFVLLSAALAANVITPTVNANMIAIVVLSMAVTPLILMIDSRFKRRRTTGSADGEAATGRAASVLIIGFGRVGQIASQGVLARGASLTVIDSSTEVIKEAQTYGFKVFFGDGSRPDVLHAAGAKAASVVIVCISDKAAAKHIADIAKDVFPQAKLLIRAYDREHALALTKAGADFVMRETFESAMELGRQAVLATGASEDDAQETVDVVRRRDSERLELEMVGGKFAGRALLLSNPDNGRSS
ncbi:MULTISPECIES: monovalent cation:proton antiporter-2 (CPA2) family protein [unclassified Roseateles]|uniref:monovalent cation:proton antiporter-2 (CPA2) family protein n=1 Tax=unclassified Roseateles TaxID=2626991 RepID=UPI0006FCC5B6|nr:MULTISPECIES: monovalent cation:proton antiporter-2 (CPA2) family protein [unclassified Roseateles]KQW49548.1 potassium transporter [Pelomonas sp. Root405]KRA75606.1 potassium transporter [Pelomonas sp. Root662]